MRFSHAAFGLAAAIAVATPAAAQTMTMAMPSASGPAGAQPQPVTANGDTKMGGMAMGSMSMEPVAMGGMVGDLGAYPMTRDASGTAWQPDSSPMEGLHAGLGGWAGMLHGYGALVYDDQGSGRGADKTFFESMLMAMAQHPYAGGTFTVRTMMSLDPLMGRTGYPELLQTGETANGVTELVDRQHPHDLFMELAGVYSHPVAPGASAFLYVGWPGEPALGPVTFMHRFSGEVNPEAPIDHHWLDSTHITYGVITTGVVWGAVKLEGSNFTGREPNPYRYDFDHPRGDSWSGRLTWNPGPDWSMQVSGGRLHSPEELTPEVNQTRLTASATYNRPLPTGTWQTTLAWGQDRNDPGHTLEAVLFESAAKLGRHTVFFRAEGAQKDELFDDDPTSPLLGRVFDVGKYTTGYAYEVPFRPWLSVDFGGLVSRYTLPSLLNAAYGADPTSFMLFARAYLR